MANLSYSKKDLFDEKQVFGSEKRLIWFEDAETDLLSLKKPNRVLARKENGSATFLCRMSWRNQDSLVDMQNHGTSADENFPLH